MSFDMRKQQWENYKKNQPTLSGNSSSSPTPVRVHKAKANATIIRPVAQSPSVRPSGCRTCGK